MVVDREFDQCAVADERVDGRGRSVGRDEEGLAVDLADDSAVDLDDGIRSDDLQVEDVPAGLDCCDHLTQDVHDVLRLDSSE
ncbi:MAG TPA: hypothetical protein VFS15_10140 [Kofleriaceae bacterium]|nr:hypothetical protein [Kofleriaceae bacterium]